MLTRLARWWLARKERRAPGPPPYVLRGECCAPGCGVELVDGQVHLVGARSTDDERLGIDTGGTAMSADFCAEHCPGGCQHGWRSVSRVTRPEVIRQAWRRYHAGEITLAQLLRVVSAWRPRH